MLRHSLEKGQALLSSFLRAEGNRGFWRCMFFIILMYDSIHGVGWGRGNNFHINLRTAEMSRCMMLHVLEMSCYMKKFNEWLPKMSSEALQVRLRKNQVYSKMQARHKTVATLKHHQKERVELRISASVSAEIPPGSFCMSLFNHVQPFFWWVIMVNHP